MPATIKDIARKLQISTSTVSYALNGGPRSVPDEVRERVLRVAKELDYRPNRLARSLITRRSHAIGVVPGAAARDIVLGPYMQHVLNGILNEAELTNQNVMLFTQCDPADLGGTMDRLLDGHVDGFVFVATNDLEPVLAELLKRNMPHISLSAQFEGTPAVFVDNASGVYSAMEHLFALGHRRIGHLQGRLGFYDSDCRYAAYRSFMKEHELEIRDNWVAEGEFTPEGGRAAARSILACEDRPTAILAANDEMAMSALAAAREFGIEVPRDLSVVGFDDVPMAMVTCPALTTVRQPIQQIAATATRLLVQLIEGKAIEPRTVLETELIIRDSTAVVGQ